MGAKINSLRSEKMVYQHHILFEDIYLDFLSTWYLVDVGR
jgi:hypothetical protein